MRMVALILVVCSGCASTKVSLTRQRGEPVISIEFASKSKCIAMSTGDLVVVKLNKPD